MTGKMSWNDRFFYVLINSIMFLLVIITLYPFLFVVFGSLSEGNKLIQHFGPLFKPLGFSLKSYEVVFTNKMLLIGYKNTLIYVVSGTFINIILTSLGAYVLSRKNLLWRNLMMFIIVFTMFFSGGLIPRFLLIKSLNMIDTIWALIIPGAISTWNLIVMRTAFMEFPDSLEESATIDGANDFYILFRIIIPVSLPLMAAMVLFYGVGHWNSWFSAMIYMRKREKYPLQLLLREIIIASSFNDLMARSNATKSDKINLEATLKYAAIVFATLPILMIYPLLQKYFVKGVMIGALKG